MVVAQLVERSVLTPEVRNSNPSIGQIYVNFSYFQLNWKGENKEKEAGNGRPILKRERKNGKIKGAVIFKEIYWDADCLRL